MILPLIWVPSLESPPDCAIICRAAAWAQKKTPFRLTSKTRSQSSSVTSRAMRWMLMPALLTKISRRPKVSTTFSTIASIVGNWVTSRGTIKASWPAARIWAAVVSAASSRSGSSVIARLAPAWARAIEMACPRPLPVPVTRAILFSTRILGKVKLSVCVFIS